MIILFIAQFVIYRNGMFSIAELRCACFHHLHNFEQRKPRYQKGGMSQCPSEFQVFIWLFGPVSCLVPGTRCCALIVQRNYLGETSQHHRG